MGVVPGGQRFDAGYTLHVLHRRSGRNLSGFASDEDGIVLLRSRKSSEWPDDRRCEIRRYRCDYGLDGTLLGRAEARRTPRAGTLVEKGALGQAARTKSL